MKQLVTTEWLEKNINKVKILDATWCLPNSGRNAEEEFKKNHIQNSIFFDIDKNKIPKFGIQILSGLKIKKKNAIISANGNLVICSARCCAKYLKNGFKGWIK